MNVNSKVLSVTHCIICDELPTAKGNFAIQLDKLQAEHDMSLAKKEMIKADKFMSETKVYHQTVVDRETEFNKKSTEVLEGNEKEEKYSVNKRVLSFIRFISPFI